MLSNQDCYSSVKESLDLILYIYVTCIIKYIYKLTSICILCTMHRKSQLINLYNKCSLFASIQIKTPQLAIHVGQTITVILFNTVKNIIQSLSYLPCVGGCITSASLHGSFRDLWPWVHLLLDSRSHNLQTV